MGGRERGLPWERAVERMVTDLGRPERSGWRRAAWWAFQGDAVADPPARAPLDHPFFDLWAALDYAPEGARRLVDRRLATPADLPLGELRALCALRDAPPRLLVARRAGAPWGRRLFDVLTGVYWPSVVAAAVPIGGMVLARLLWRPGATRLVGPAVLFPAGEASAGLRVRLRADYHRARAHGYVQTIDQFYRVATPALYRAQRAIHGRALIPGDVALAARAPVAQSPGETIGGTG